MTNMSGNEGNRMKRNANIIDMFRLIACFCVVWYHSSYYGLLDPVTQRPLVDTAKMFMITWTMPLFFVTSSRFALKSMMFAPGSKFINRIKGLFLINLAFVIIYDIPNYIFEKGYSKYPFHMGLSGDTFPAKMKDLWDTMITGNHSPVYFIVHLIIIYIFAFIISKLVRLGRMGRNLSIAILVFTLFCMATINVSSMVELGKALIIGHHVIGFMCIGFLYEILNISQYVKAGSKNAPWYVIFLFILLPIIIIEIIYGRFHGGEFSNVPLLFSAAVWTTVLFLIIGDRYKELKHPVALKFSEWGQKYSMGIFLIHFFTLIFVTKFLKHAWTWIGFENPSLFVYVCINVTGFFVSLGIVYLLKKSKYTRWLVELENQKQDNPVMSEIERVAKQIDEWYRVSKRNKKAQNNMLKVSKYLKENKMM